MPSIPVDVLREILEHVDKADLVTLCQVNKICCSYSQDILYRDILVGDARITRVLARSPDLAKRVRSFDSLSPHPPRELSTALKNMTSLRHLGLIKTYDAAVLDGCTFQLDTFDCWFYYGDPLRKFLASQPSLTYVNFYQGLEESISFEQTLLPNLTRLAASLEWFPTLLPGRPVRLIDTHDPDFSFEYVHPDLDLSFFTLSAGPLQKLSIPFFFLYLKPASVLISTFPFLTHLVLTSYYMEHFEVSEVVRKTSFY
jgi:hypothetical protein